jgi:hypothetical protein
MNEAIDHSDGKKTVKPFRRHKMLKQTRVIHEVYGCSGDLRVSSDLGIPCTSQALRNRRYVIEQQTQDKNPPVLTKFNSQFKIAAEEELSVK